MSRDSLRRLVRLNGDFVGTTDSQELTNKTLKAESNIIRSTTPALGNILKDNGTKYVPLTKGSAGLPLRVNDAATDVGYTALGVAGGGTGVATISSGSLLVGAGTSPITTKAAPSGAILGDSDVQNITGAKTFLHQTLKERNPANTFTLTQTSPAITVDRSTITSLVPYHWDTLVWKDTTNTRILAFSKDGTILAQAVAGNSTTSADDTVIQAAIDNTPDKGTCWIMPGTYIVGDNVSAIDFDTVDMVSIFAYGVTVEAHSDSHSGFMFRPAVGRSMAIYGMTVDLKDNWGAAFGTNVDTEAKFIGLRDIIIKNIHSYGILTGNQNTVVNDNSELLVENIKVDAGGVLADNECIAARCNGRVTIRNAVLQGNKAMHISSRYITLENVSCDGSAYTGLSEMSPLNGEFIDVRNVYMKDLALTLRPFLSMDGTTAFGNCRQATVSGYVHVEGGSVMNGIQFGGYENTTGGTSAQIENAVLENFNLQRAGVYLVPHAQASSGTIKNLTIRNGYMDTVSGNERILVDRNINVNFLTIENIEVGTYGTATEAPISIFTNIAAGRDSDITIGRCKLENITPESTANIIRAGDNGSGVAKTVTVTFERPLGNNIKGSNVSGVATLVMRFRENSGKATFSGNASTTVFNIPHILSAAPSANSITVTPGSTDAVGPPVITSDATNIIVTYPVAPATGTSNIILYWRARAG